MDQTHAPLLDAMIGQVVVVDMVSTYVCLGTLAAYDRDFLELVDADMHDFRDSTETRETYVYDSVRFGIRRNRARCSCTATRWWPSPGSPTSPSPEPGLGAPCGFHFRTSCGRGASAPSPS